MLGGLVIHDNDSSSRISSVKIVDLRNFQKIDMKYKDLATRIILAVEKESNTYDAVEKAEKILEHDVRYGWDQMKNLRKIELSIWRKGFYWGLVTGVTGLGLLMLL